MRAIRHVGIVVSDMEEALGFFRDLLGLTVARTLDEGGPYLAALLAIPGVRATTVKLSADAGETMVELLKFHSPEARARDTREPSSLGLTHVAFTVADLEALYARLTRAGVRFLSRPQRSPDGYVLVAFCYGPDDVLVELVEMLAARGDGGQGAA